MVEDKTGMKLQRIVDELGKSGLDVHSMESLKKTAPKEHPKEHSRIELLRLKGLVVSRHWPPAAWLGTAAAKQRVLVGVPRRQAHAVVARVNRRRPLEG